MDERYINYGRNEKSEGVYITQNIKSCMMSRKYLIWGRYCNNYKFYSATIFLRNSHYYEFKNLMYI
jgi:hypothetical protein